MIHIVNISLAGIVLFLSANIAAALGLWIPNSNFPHLLNHDTRLQATPLPPSQNPTIIRVGKTAADMAAIEQPTKDAYSVIVEKDLFHPTRKKHVVPKVAPRPLPKKTTQIKAPKPEEKLPRRSPTHPRKDPKKKRSERLALQGVVLFGDYQRALIADLLRKPRDPVDVGIGDTIGRYTVQEILEDRVILTAGTAETRTLELMAEDKLNRRSHVVTPTPGSASTRATSATKKGAKKTKSKKKSSTK